MGDYFYLLIFYMTGAFDTKCLLSK